MTVQRRYERKVSEIFGYSSEAASDEMSRLRREYECPFLGARCVKPSQHRDYDPSIPFGACSVWHRSKGMSNPQPYVICPIRFVQDRRIFLDASRGLKMRENTEIIVLPEVSLSMGRIDYILALYDTAKEEVADFVVLEVMACSTTRTGDILQSFHDILQGRKTERRLGYGINLRQVVSRMMVQVLAKAYACEKWNKQMIWAVQDVLYQYMQATTKIDLHKVPLAASQTPPFDLPILFHVYGMELDAKQEKFELKLKEIYGGTKESFAKILEPMILPETDGLIELIRQKIQDRESTFTLSDSFSDGLAQMAGKIIRESPIDESA